MLVGVAAGMAEGSTEADGAGVVSELGLGTGLLLGATTVPYYGGYYGYGLCLWWPLRCLWLRWRLLHPKKLGLGWLRSPCIETRTGLLLTPRAN